MPRPISADWDAMKALFLKGVTLPDIARQTGVSYHAVRARALRYKWRATAAAGAAMLQQHVAMTLAERGQKWGPRVATLMERQLDYFESLDPSKLKLKELEMLARITDTTDKTARRTFGLDQEQQGASSMQVGIVLHNVSHCDKWAGSAAATVVDVDVVPVPGEVGHGGDVLPVPGRECVGAG